MLEMFRNYLKEEDYYIVLYSNYIYIYKYLDIIKFTDIYISLKLKSFKLNVYGIDLLISKLECDELLIKGIINKVEKIYE